MYIQCVTSLNVFCKLTKESNFNFTLPSLHEISPCVFATVERLILRKYSYSEKPDDMKGRTSNLLEK